MPIPISRTIRVYDSAGVQAVTYTFTDSIDSASASYPQIVGANVATYCNTFATAFRNLMPNTTIPVPTNSNISKATYTITCGPATYTLTMDPLAAVVSTAGLSAALTAINAQITLGKTLTSITKIYYNVAVTTGVGAFAPTAEPATTISKMIMLVGIIVGVIVLLLILGITTWYFMRKSKGGR
jgi:hypothetical protein